MKMQRRQERRRGYLNKSFQKENRGKTGKVNGEKMRHIIEKNNNRIQMKK